MADLSFIIPARNLGGYIEACLASVATPLSIATEIIVVDDASTDDTAARIEAFASAHRTSHIRLLSTGSDAPKGPGFSRNLGLQHANAPKVAFVDGDDWISAPAYVNLAVLMDRHDADFGWMRTLVFSERKGEFWPFYDEHIRSEIKGTCNRLVTNLVAEPRLAALEPSMCNRVFRTSFMQQAVGRYPEGLLYEDLPVHFNALFAAERIVLTYETGYFYRTQRRGKITDRNDQSRFDLVKSMALMNEGVFAQHEHSAAGVHVVSFLAQFALWCAMSVPLTLRPNLVSQLAEQFARLPDEWTQAALQPDAVPMERAYMLWLLLQGDAAMLGQLHSGMARPESDTDFMVTTHRQEPPPPEPEIAPEPEPEPAPEPAPRRSLLRRAAGRARRLIRP